MVVVGGMPGTLGVSAGAVGAEQTWWRDEGMVGSSTSMAQKSQITNELHETMLGLKAEWRLHQVAADPRDTWFQQLFQVHEK